MILANASEIEEEDLEKFLIFELCNECFGVSVKNVGEIIRLQKITRVPKVQSYILGILNLRGKVIPVIDLKNRLNLKEPEDNEAKHACKIVLQFNNEDNHLCYLAIVVDSVLEVIVLPKSHIEENIDLGFNVDRQCIKGIAKAKRGMLSIMDVHHMISSKDRK